MGTYFNTAHPEGPRPLYVGYVSPDGVDIGEELTQTPLRVRLHSAKVAGKALPVRVKVHNVQVLAEGYVPPVVSTVLVRLHDIAVFASKYVKPHVPVLVRLHEVTVMGVEYVAPVPRVLARAHHAELLALSLPRLD